MKLPTITAGLVRRRRRPIDVYFTSAQLRSASSTSAFSKAFSSESPIASTSDSHTYLSAGQALRAAGASDRTGTGSSAAGLTFTLPPLCIWGTSADSQSDADHGHTRRHRAAGDHGRYSSIWAPVEAYLEELSKPPSSSQEAGSAAPPSPPVCVTLRLFPDLTIAQLPTLHVPASDTTSRHVSNSRNDCFAAAQTTRRRQRRVLAPHEQPLEAILATEAPWGSGADPQRVFRDALKGLQEMGQRLLPRLPLVLQLPTRLLVSQQFLDDVASLLVRSGWRSVAFELPPTHQLYGPPQFHYGRPGAEMAERGNNGVDSGSLQHQDDGAIDGAWCRLPLLCTPWPVLCRHPSLGPSLRRLRRHDVVPFHVLFSWALTEARLFQQLEQSMAVDVTAPATGAAVTQAKQWGPQSVGVSAEEARRQLRASELSTDMQRAVQAFETGENGQDEEGEEHGRRSAGATRVFMSENPTTSRRAGVGLSDGVMTAVRQHQSRAGRDAASYSTSSSDRERHSSASAASSAANADLAAAEAALRRAKSSSTASAPPHHASLPVNTNDDGLLILDTPPDHLRALIEKSIVQDAGKVSGDGALGSSPSLTPRQQLLQKVGQFMQHSLQHDAADAPSTTASPGVSEEQLEQEAAELEALLRHANESSDAAAASANVEHMMQEMQRYMQSRDKDSGDHPAHRVGEQQQDGRDLLPESGAGGAGSAWLRCGGYWACMTALLENVTKASLVWTLPTYNAAAVRAWKHAYAASNSAALHATEAGKARKAAPVVPVWMPLQSAMHTEVERLLREGQRYPAPPQPTFPPQQEPQASATTAAPYINVDAEACRTWLPPELNAALGEALSRLPADFQAHERRRHLRDYRVLRDGGAQAARRGGCDIHHGTSFRDSRDDDNNADSSLVEDEEAGEVRILLRRGVLPFYVLTPSQVAAREAEERRKAAAALSVSSDVDGSAETNVKAVLETVRDVDEAFAAAVLDYYDAAAAAVPDQKRCCKASSLYVPAPGLDASQTHRSWRAV